ncbi:unnamed protein product [Effrenium voratum]|nr:unnamed protein product [Effrenium voratum]CAJ1440510.1 unnamed protein product [Effrenium voratum]
MAEAAAGEAEADASSEKSVFELLDELIGVDRSTLLKILGFCVSVLLLISGVLVCQEIAAGRSHLAAIYGGFFLLVLGLIASVAFVLNEASKFEATGTKKDE